MVESLRLHTPNVIGKTTVGKNGCCETERTFYKTRPSDGAHEVNGYTGKEFAVDEVKVKPVIIVKINS